MKFNLVISQSILICIFSNLLISMTANATAGGASAKADVTNGRITSISLTSGGSGYTTAPTIFILDSNGGSGATAKAEVAGGSVINVLVTEGGSGYNMQTVQVIFLPNVTDIGDAPTDATSDIPTDIPTDENPDAPTEVPTDGTSIESSENSNYFITSKDNLTEDSIVIGPYPGGDVMTLEAQITPGYLFSHWSGDVSGTNSTISFTLNDDTTIISNFLQDNNDTDGDGLSNYSEIIEHKTDDNDADSDDDSIPDGKEIEFGLNPLASDAQLVSFVLSQSSSNSGSDSSGGLDSNSDGPPEDSNTSLEGWVYFNKFPLVYSDHNKSWSYVSTVSNNLFVFDYKDQKWTKLQKGEGQSYNEGITAGQNAVTSNPSTYGLYSPTQLESAQNQYYNSGYQAGQNAGNAQDGGFAPSTLGGKTFHTVDSDGDINEVYLYPNSTRATSTNVYGTLDGTYIYEKTGANTGHLVGNAYYDGISEISYTTITFSNSSEGTYSTSYIWSDGDSHSVTGAFRTF